MENSKVSISTYLKGENPQVKFVPRSKDTYIKYMVCTYHARTLYSWTYLKKPRGKIAERTPESSNRQVQLLTLKGRTQNSIMKGEP